MRTATILIALLMTTSGMFALNVQAQVDAEGPIAEAEGAYECILITPDVTSCDEQLIQALADELGIEWAAAADEAYQLGLFIQNPAGHCAGKEGGQDIRCDAYRAATANPPVEIETLGTGGIRVTIHFPDGVSFLSITADPAQGGLEIRGQDGSIYSGGMSMSTAQNPMLEEQGPLFPAHVPYLTASGIDQDRFNVFVDVDATPARGSDCDDPCQDNSIDELYAAAWARIRFDDDGAAYDDEDGNGRPDVHDVHTLDHGAIHIRPFCVETLLLGCVHVTDLSPYDLDGRNTLTISELHFKEPDKGDYLRYYLYSDLDDDGHADIDEANCGSNPFHRESTCDDHDGDELSNAAEAIWGSNPFNKDSDGDGLWDGFEDWNSDGLLDPVPALMTDGAENPWFLVGDEGSVGAGFYPNTHRWGLGESVAHQDYAPDRHRWGHTAGATFTNHAAFFSSEDLVETSPVTKNTDGDDSDDWVPHHGNHLTWQGDLWHDHRLDRDPHPQEPRIDAEDRDGDGLFDTCERPGADAADAEQRGNPRPAREGGTAPEDLTTIGSFGTTLHHGADNDGDGLVNSVDCNDARANAFMMDTDGDGLRDDEELFGELLHGGSAELDTLPHGLSTYPAGHTSLAYRADSDYDGAPDILELFAAWDAGITRLGVTTAPLAPDWALINDVLKGTAGSNAPTDDAWHVFSTYANVQVAAADNADRKLREGDLYFDLETYYPAVTDPGTEDMDGDGVPDGEELLGEWYIYSRSRSSGNAVDDRTFIPTDPHVLDTDGDGYGDGVETVDDEDPTGCHDLFFHPGSSGSAHNSHPCDGGHLKWLGSQAFLIDSDGDGLTDKHEIGSEFHNYQYDYDCTLVVGNIVICTTKFRSDPRAYDTDGDGLSDAEETKDTFENDRYIGQPLVDPVTGVVSPARLDCGSSKAPKDVTLADCDGGYGTMFFPSGIQRDTNERAWVPDTAVPGVLGPELNEDLLAVPWHHGRDTDQDTISDYQELALDFSDYLGAEHLTEPGPHFTLPEFASDPFSKNSDGDSLTDQQEVQGSWSTLALAASATPDAHEAIDGQSSGTFKPTHPGKIDTDGDGLNDDVEVKDKDNPSGCPSPSPAGPIPCDGGWGTDPTLVDTDGDTHSDFIEVEAGTDPLSAASFPGAGDTDLDGLIDQWELDYFGNLDQGPDDDPDLDGYTNLQEQATRVLAHMPDTTCSDQAVDPCEPPESHPRNRRSTPADRDADGLPYSWENDHWEGEQFYGPNDDPDQDGLTNAEEFNSLGSSGLPVGSSTDPTVWDTDGDGLSDGDEVNVHGTDPLNTDTDGDGLSDGDEVSGTANTYDGQPMDPRSTDSDGDLMSDDAEVGRAEPTNPNAADTDGDGFTDYSENQDQTDPNDPESNAGEENASQARVPDPVQVVTNRDCDFTQPVRVEGGQVKEGWAGDDDMWNEEECNDTRGPAVGGEVFVLLARILGDANGVIAAVQDIIGSQGVEDASSSTADAAAGAINSGHDQLGLAVTTAAGFTDQNDPRDLDSDGITTEPNGQPDLIERNVVYLDADQPGDDENDRFDGHKGSTIVLVSPSDGSPVGRPSQDRVLTVRIGDVAGTPANEVFVFEVLHMGSARVTVCLHADGTIWTTGTFGASGCDDVLVPTPGEAVDIVFDQVIQLRDLVLDTIADSDGDGFADAVETRAATDPEDPESHPATPVTDHLKDTDDDGFTDTLEGIFESDPADSESTPATVLLGKAADPDGDGFPSAVEAEWGTDPHDGDDHPATPVEEMLVDTDNDNFPDAVESALGSNPDDGEETPITKVLGLVTDTDGDGYPDALEYEAGTNPNDPGDHPARPVTGLLTDTDEDGFPDILEDIAGSDPADGDSTPVTRAMGLTADTDGDGFSDAVEEAAGSDPEDDGDTPATFLDANGDWMLDAAEPQFEAKCTDYAGEPVYLCHHGDGASRNYYIIVMGIDVQVDV